MNYEELDNNEKLIESLILKAKKLTRAQKFQEGLVGKLKELTVYPIYWLARFGNVDEKLMLEVVNESHLFTKVWYEGNKFYSYQRGDLCIYRFKPPGLVINGFPEKTKASKQDLIFEIIDLKRQIEELKK